MSYCDKRNLSLMTDLYELTMANGYFLNNCGDTKAIFDVFYRKNPDRGGFAIFAGLEQVIDYVTSLHFEKDEIDYLYGLKIYSDDFLDYLKEYRFSGNVYAFDEGRIIYPSEPIVTVEASLIDAQLIETAILNFINHQSLIATKTQRIVRAAGGRAVADFGARRAQNIDAAVYGARAAYIGGVSSTATVLAGKEFNIPVSGTMAHSWIMYFEDEYTAFKKYAEIYPDGVVLLVDTYNVLESGIPNAIKLSKEVLEPIGKRIKGVRIDSGDLAYLSKKVRIMLDEAGLSDCNIIASNSLDEYTITSILNQGGCFNSFGVGERLITAKSDPVFGAVYKLSQIEKEGKTSPKMKVSEMVEKATNPGRKEVYRVYDKKGHAVSDLITLYGENPKDDFKYLNPNKPWKERKYPTDVSFKKLQKLVVENGKRVEPIKDLNKIRDFVKEQLEKEIWKEEQRFENPHIHYMDYSLKLYNLKVELLHQD